MTVRAPSGIPTSCIVDAKLPRPDELFPEALVRGLADAPARGGLLTLDHVAPAAWGHLVAMLARARPGATILSVVEGVKAQESLHADASTWVVPGPAPLFFPAWEVLPHERKLPHADVISERLGTLLALLGERSQDGPARVIVATAAALMQRTFPAEALHSRLRRVRKGDRCNPLDLIEWLEEQGFEPETQVTGKGELAWRGGIVDVWPLPSPWPVRIEFFGDEVESIREFDPQAQVSREAVEEALLAPAGELGLLQPRGEGPVPELGSLVDYLPEDTVVVWCDPDGLRMQALSYWQQLPEGSPFVLGWDAVEDGVRARGLAQVLASDVVEADKVAGAEVQSAAAAGSMPMSASMEWKGLDAYRPLGTTLPEPQVAEAQRREFFLQIHRWQRQRQQVHVFCGHAGERQRFLELWGEFGLGDAPPPVHLGLLGRGFLVPSAGLVVVTDAEIYGRYKVQRPRRMKSPHAQAVRSVFEIDFNDFDEGDHVVHL